MPLTIIVPGLGAATNRLRSSATRPEALSLYPYILRTARAFHWCDDLGTPWRTKLIAEARREFEACRTESDPLLIARMIVTGRGCVEEVRRKFNDADQECMKRIRRESTNSRDGGGPGWRTLPPQGVTGKRIEIGDKKEEKIHRPTITHRLRAPLQAWHSNALLFERSILHSFFLSDLQTLWKRRRSLSNRIITQHHPINKLTFDVTKARVIYYLRQ